MVAGAVARSSTDWPAAIGFLLRRNPALYSVELPQLALSLMKVQALPLFLRFFKILPPSHLTDLPARHGKTCSVLKYLLPIGKHTCWTAKPPSAFLNVNGWLFVNAEAFLVQTAQCLVPQCRTAGVSTYPQSDRLYLAICAFPPESSTIIAWAVSFADPLPWSFSVSFMRFGSAGGNC